VDCNTRLPNGAAVGDAVRTARASLDKIYNDAFALGQYSVETDPMFQTLGAFAAIVRPVGPIDFKNAFAGKLSDQTLGDAGNFAYYAIGSGYFSDSTLDIGAAVYAVPAATIRSLGLSSNGPTFRELTGRYFSDTSADRMRNPGLNAGGCKKP
jgi:hypothetical protein